MEGAKESPTVTTDLERAIETVVECYNKHCHKSFWNNKEQGINQNEFREMLRNKLNHMLNGAKEKKLADEEFKRLDADGDKKISFDEYWNLMSEMAQHFSKRKEYEAEKKDGP
ncbi:protein S100-A16 [Protobothrops mucrosquamatus]|uniref:protein S100-A16 n=1 Tax=Protobothrops mucrosquamatus TaxID=103944 RepID=UPI000775A4A7|nr:protein S100-A16 [Protobothrops mucrosquamatus]